jgi:predicted phosphodiesterase
MKRRDFLATLPLSALAIQATTLSLSAQDVAPSADSASIIDSPPLLQNPCEDSMNVVWAVKSHATGYVELGETPELGQKIVTDHFGLNPYDDRFIQTRITGLSPGKTYYYRTVTVPVDFKNAYNIVPGEAVFSKVYRFKTPEAGASNATFSVINDTHQNTPVLAKLTQKLEELQADYTLWNGDMINDFYTDEQVITNIARPADSAFAAEKPLLFVRGNHEYRGPWARNLPRLLTPWCHADPKYRNLGYSFAFRQGPLAIIGLDTGEDKPDAHPVFSDMVQNEHNMHRQAEWLEETLKRPDIASAPYIVVVCHIPLYDPRPNANPGTTMEGYAAYSGLGLKLWGAILNQAGVQLVISAHQHSYRFSEPDAGRRWAQLVGGGHASDAESRGAPTVIHGNADGNTLVITVHNVANNTVRETFEFQPRKV